MKINIEISGYDPWWLNYTLADFGVEAAHQEEVDITLWPRGTEYGRNKLDRWQIDQEEAGGIPCGEVFIKIDNHHSDSWLITSNAAGKILFPNAEEAK
jgi:hypothetical protein